MSKLARFALAVAASLLLAACASPQDKAYKAQEKSYQADAKMKEERLKLLDEYKKCVANNAERQEEACGYLLKAIESTK